MDRPLFTSLRRIPTANGDVRHALKISDPGFAGFGEAYFSTVDAGAVKGWRRHRTMTLNLVVACGEMRFIVHDSDTGTGQHFHLTPDRDEAYGRLTVPAGLWVAFGGVGSPLNLLLNIASIPHDPMESETRPLEAFPWTWGSHTL